MSIRRRISLVLAAAAAVLPLSACALDLGDTGTAEPTRPSAGTRSGSANGSSSQAGPTKDLQVGALTVRIPQSWNAVRNSAGDGAEWHVLTGGSCPQEGYPEADTCRGWWIFEADEIALGDEGRPYTPDRPFYPRTDSVPCPTDPESFQTTPRTARVQGFTDVGSHKAHYREWQITCISPAGGAKTGGFVQRVVYLPDSRLLLVDNWQTTGLIARLRGATWS